MAKEKSGTFKKNIIKIGLIAGIGILILLVFASIAGIILSLCSVCDILAVSASVFVAAISSLLTVLALILSVKSSNEMIVLQNKLIELQRDTIDIQRIDKNSSSLNSINLVRNSLSLETIEIDRSLIFKEVTHKSSYQGKKKNKNFRIGLNFLATNINELSGIALRNLELYFRYKLPHNENINIVLRDDQSPFLPIEVKSNNKFLYEIITKIDDSRYQDILTVLKSKPDCELCVKIQLALQSNAKAISNWIKKSSRSLHFKLCGYNELTQKYIFTKVAKYSNNETGASQE